MQEIVKRAAEFIEWLYRSKYGTRLGLVLLLMLPLSWGSSVRAQTPTCEVREITRLADQGIVFCESGPVPITRRQYLDLSVQGANAPHTFCSDGTQRATAVLATRFDTASGQPESCDVFTASNVATRDHIAGIRLPDGRDMDIDTTVNRPVRDAQGRLSGYDPPLTRVTITGPRTTSLWQRFKQWLQPTLHAAVTFDQASSGSGGSTLVSSLTYSATVANQADRALYVGLCAANSTGNETTADTFNAVDMTLLAQAHSLVTNTANAYLFRLVAPDVTTANVSFTFSVARRVASGALTVYGVDQAAPDDTPVTAVNSADTDEETVNVATVTDDMIVDVGCGRSTVQTFTMGAQTNRTERYSDLSSAAGSAQVYTKGSTRTGTGTLAMNYTLTGAVNGIAIVGVNVNQVPPAASALTRKRVLWPR